MLSFSQIYLQRGTKLIFDYASVVLFENQKIGIVGQNGCGKSTLFAIIKSELSPDSGEFKFQNQMVISDLEQEFPEENLSALDYVLSGDKEYTHCLQQMTMAETQGNAELLTQMHEVMQNIQGYSKPALACSILAGLGFSKEQQNWSIKNFSGGWQMRLGLARCLMTPADLYLLDEPTNHLDLEAIIWLEKWLKNLRATVLVISHDREFLDQVVEKTLHIDQQKFKLYSGNYSYFERARAEQLKMQNTLYERQQDKIRHMMSFVERFKAKATKAKQAQSRLKAIEKIELIAQAHLDQAFDFSFFEIQDLKNPLMKCQNVQVGYSIEKPILNQIHLELHTQDRIGLLGLNGQGKSTFIKTLVGEISPLSGDIIRQSKLNIGYYAQHQLEQLDSNSTPFQVIQELDIKLKEDVIRKYLGRFGFQGDTVFRQIRSFSGGEKARLAFAKMIWLKPDVLLLDEPTNHLDLDIREAIVLALQTYQGAVILISHDRHLLNTTVNQFYLIHQGKLEFFSGDLTDYFQWLFSNKIETQSEVNSKVKNIDYKNVKSMQNRLKKIEQEMERFRRELKKIDELLCDESLYINPQNPKLLNYHQSQKKYQQELILLEEEWMTLMMELE